MIVSNMADNDSWTRSSKGNCRIHIADLQAPLLARPEFALAKDYARGVVLCRAISDKVDYGYG